MKIVRLPLHCFIKDTACEEIVQAQGGNAIPYDLDVLAAKVIEMTDGNGKANLQ